MDSNVVGFLAGCIIIGLVTILIVFMISVGQPSLVIPDDWETLVVGALAVLGAFFSIWMISKQIRQVEDHRKDDITRQSDAARAVMPLALSSLTRYSMDCLRELKKILDNERVELAFPDISGDVIAPLRDCVRFSDGKRRHEIADLLGDLQVQQARLQDMSRIGPRNRTEVVEYCLDSIELYGRCTSLFSYARREEDDDIQTLASAARVLEIDKGRYSDLDERLEQAEDRYLSTISAYRK